MPSLPPADENFWRAWYEQRDAQRRHPRLAAAAKHIRNRGGILLLILLVMLVLVISTAVHLIDPSAPHWLTAPSRWLIGNRNGASG